MKAWLVVAIAVLLMLAAIPVVMHLLPGPGGTPTIDFTDGTELQYTTEQPEAAAATLRRRLEAYGARAEADTHDGRVRVRIASDEPVDTVKQLIAMRGGLEFRVTVEPGDRDDYGQLWQQFGGEGSRDVAAGLRWYPVSADSSIAAERRKDRWILCVVDEHDITDESLHEIRAGRDVNALHDSWAINFRVRREAQAAMADLTSQVDSHLAIIVNGEVLAAPVLNSTLSDSGQITGGYDEQEARMLAATLAAGLLPGPLVLHSEKRIT